MPSALEVLQNGDLAEEIEAINAIYDQSTIDVEKISTVSPDIHRPRTLDLGSANADTDGVTATVTLKLPDHPHLSFVIGFDDQYPETAPKVLGTASTASRGEGRIAVDVLKEIIHRTHQPGQVCLYEVISDANEKFSELSFGKPREDAEAEEGKTEATDVEVEKSLATLSLRDTFGIDSPPEWSLSDVVTEKKSVFVGRAAHVTSRKQAQAYIDHLLATDKRAAAATHNISAWRIRETKADGVEMTFQDYDDDGETAAGGRLLHMMQLMDVWDVVVVVTRWFGGILLGPDRFRIINNVGKDALLKGGFAGKDSSTGKEKGKKKERK
ncbi:hypothetical protein VTN31DRAFT_5071 [Thermomyces dupontii]|uniref:uncharacterized protein n=1 Tax=Talaromyces thermophilus TaxID=28565 RepID=UPI0037447343